MREVIAMISAEQEMDYADVPVRMLKELAEAQINCLTDDHETELLSIE